MNPKSHKCLGSLRILRDFLRSSNKTEAIKALMKWPKENMQDVSGAGSSKERKVNQLKQARGQEKEAAKPDAAKPPDPRENESDDAAPSLWETFDAVDPAKMGLAGLRRHARPN